MGVVNSVKILLVTVTVKGHFAALELLDGSCFVPMWSPTSTTCEGGGEVGKGETEGRRGGRITRKGGGRGARGGGKRGNRREERGEEGGEGGNGGRKRRSVSQWNTASYGYSTVTHLCHVPLLCQSFLPSHLLSQNLLLLSPLLFLHQGS